MHLKEVRDTTRNHYITFDFLEKREATNNGTKEDEEDWTDDPAVIASAELAMEKLDDFEDAISKVYKGYIESPFENTKIYLWNRS